MDIECVCIKVKNCCYEKDCKRGIRKFSEAKENRESGILLTISLETKHVVTDTRTIVFFTTTNGSSIYIYGTNNLFTSCNSMQNITCDCIIQYTIYTYMQYAHPFSINQSKNHSYCTSIKHRSYEE